MCANASERRIGEALIDSHVPAMTFVSAAAPSTSVDQHLSSAVKRALLETIVAGVASKRQDIVDYFR